MISERSSQDAGSPCDGARTTAAYRYSIRLDYELQVARQNAHARFEQACALTAAGQHLAADVYLLAARMYQDSARYWEEELRVLQRASP